jgi:hypothetical protein
MKASVQLQAPGSFTPRGRAAGTHCTGLRAAADACGEEENLCPHLKPIPGHTACSQPLAELYGNPQRKCFFTNTLVCEISGSRRRENLKTHLTYRPDDGGSKHLWIVGKLQSDNTAQHPTRQSSSFLGLFNYAFSTAKVNTVGWL